MSTLFKNKLLLRYFQSKQSRERPLIGINIKPDDYPIPTKYQKSQKPLGPEASIKAEMIHT